MIGVNIDGEFIDIACNFLNYKRGGIPFNYLGLPVGANVRKFSTWESLVEKVKRRLINWGNKYVSFGGRITDDRSSYVIFSICFLVIFSRF